MRGPVCRIVVLRPNHRMGNTVLLTPLVHDLGARFPGAEIELVIAGRAARAVFNQYAQVSEVHAFPARSFRHPGHVLRVLARLRQRSYDLAVDPTPHSRGGRFLLGQVHARDRVGFRWGVPHRDRMLTHTADASHAPPHCALTPVYLLRSAYAPGPTHETDARLMMMPQLDLRLTDAERRDGERRLFGVLGTTDPGAATRLGIYAHATGTKCYPVSWWRRVVEELRQLVPDVRIVEFVPHDGRARLAGDVPVLYATKLRPLGAALAATSLFVTADCGVMHLADAAGARVLGLFKTTEPARYGPYGATSEALRAFDASPGAAVAHIRALLASRAVTQRAPCIEAPS